MAFNRSAVQTVRPRNQNHHQACLVLPPPSVRKEVPSPNSSLNRSDQRPERLTRQKQEFCLSFLTAEPRLENRDYFADPSQKLTSTNELLNIRSRATISILSLYFLHWTKKKEHITTHEQGEILKARSFQEAAQIFSQSFALLDGKEAQAFTVQNFNPQEDERDAFNPKISSGYLIISLHVSR